MIFGLSISTFITIHTIISLIGIASGLVALYGLLTSQRLEGWTALFLATTVLTSVTGFGFPFTTFLPSHWTGVISLVVLAVALYALYARHLEGRWRAAYVVTAVMALYLNCFVAVVQLFLKIPFFKALAPTQSEPPFLVAQIAVLAIFVWFGFRATRRFHPA